MVRDKRIMACHKGEGGIFFSGGVGRGFLTAILTLEF
jgi:hypothetical protein